MPRESRKSGIEEAVLAVGGEMEVMSIPLNDATINPVLPSPSREYSPGLSRDGRWLA